MANPTELIIWRDSVCAGDDCDAPHERRIRIDAEEPLLRLAEQLCRGRYLASIAGGRATWILESSRPLAVFAQQWDEPRFLVDPESPIVTHLAASVPHFEFRYWCQVDPDRVYHCLLQGQPLTDRYGRE